MMHNPFAPAPEEYSILYLAKEKTLEHNLQDLNQPIQTDFKTITEQVVIFSNLWNKTYLGSISITLPAKFQDHHKVYLKL